MVYDKLKAKERNAERRAKAVELLGSVCVTCGSRERLEFDHIDPNDKLTEVQWLLSGDRLKLLEELNKCQLLCNTCHRNKTAKSKLVDHHGLTRYKRGCRCDVCKLANTESKRVWRENKKAKQ